MKKLISIIILVFSIANTYCINASEIKPYGVFVGMGSNELERLYEYKEVIIDAAYYTKEDLELLHKKDVKVYSYLNIGSLEKFRPYYEEYQDITLGEYENWPNERWVDVSVKKWQELVVDQLAKELSDKGVDGFFLDNTVVYEVYTEDKIYKGVLDIITKLKQTYNKKIIVNGGFGFLKKAVEKKINLKEIIDGVNRESVMTNIDFKKSSFKLRPEKQAESALQELRNISSKVNDIYVIEYSKRSSTNSKIIQKYKNTNFKVYIAKSIALD